MIGKSHRLALQEMEQENIDESAGQLLNKDNLDRLVVARLIETPPHNYPQSPVAYLMKCYNRALDEARSRAVTDSAQLQEAVKACRELIINYSGLALAGDIIPHNGPAVSSGFSGMYALTRISILN
jgi:hypothetical protein